MVGLGKLSSSLGGKAGGGRLADVYDELAFSLTSFSRPVFRLGRGHCRVHEPADDEVNIGFDEFRRAWLGVSSGAPAAASVAPPAPHALSHAQNACAWESALCTRGRPRSGRRPRNDCRRVCATK